MLKIDLKKFFFDRPIKEKVGAVILLVLSVIFVCNVIFLPVQQRRTAMEKMRLKGKLTIRMVTYNLKPVVESKDLKPIDEAVKSAFQDPDLFYIAILRYQYKDTLSYSTGGAGTTPTHDYTAYSWYRDFIFHGGKPSGGYLSHPGEPTEYWKVDVKLQPGRS